MRNRKPPDRKTVLIYLVVGLALVALASVLLGGSGGFGLARLLLIYGAAFLLLLWILGRARNR